MKRRTFIKTSALTSLGLSLTGFNFRSKTHILTLSFDDGYKKSFYKIAEIHERYGLMSCLNIIASGHTWGTNSPDEYQRVPLGNFDDWNTLKARGHEVMPHSWDHTNLTEIPLDEAKNDIIKCLDFFEANLNGFRASDAVYNFAYNASTPELIDFALSRVKAVRTGGWSILDYGKRANPFPDSNGPFKLGCWSYGPDNANEWVEKEVNEFLISSGGWLILNLHGLDDEGWGPINTDYLNKLLKRLIKIDYLDILPTGEILKQMKG